MRAAPQPHKDLVATRRTAARAMRGLLLRTMMTMARTTTMVKAAVRRSRHTSSAPSCRHAHVCFEGRGALT